MNTPRPKRLGRAALAALLLLGGCAAPRPAAPLARFEFDQPQMGVPFRIVLYAPEEARAAAAAQAAFERVRALNGILSDYEYDSELSALSRTAGSGAAVPVSADLWRVLEAAQAMARASEGAFDITVRPCVSLWRKARRERQLPDPARLARARAAVSFQWLELDPRRRTARLRAPGMRLDLGGIAKGYALDEAGKVLRNHGVDRYLVSGGGDMAAGEAPPGKPGWRIEVAPLDVPDAPPARFVLLRRAGLATSGDLFQHVEIDGRRYSHILDPHTGLGLTDHSLVTVIAPTGMAADALSTAVSVLGPARGMRLVESQRAAACIARKPAERLEWFQTRRFAGFLEPASARGPDRSPGSTSGR